MKHKHGGPAYPTIEWGRTVNKELAQRTDHVGMTLRDYFAGQAIAGMLANPDWTNNNTYIPDRGDSIPEIAYKVADAMLTRREATQ